MFFRKIVNRSLFILLLFSGFSHAQTAVVTYPLSGDTLESSNATIYFNPPGSPYEQYRITLGSTNTGKGLHDSGVQDEQAYEYVIPASDVPTDGSPVFLKFWQRPQGGSWNTFVIAYATEDSGNEPVRPGKPVLTTPIGTSDETTPIFIWQSNVEVNRYRIQLRDSSSNANLHTRSNSFNAFCTGSSCQYTSPVTLTPGKSYKWRVRAQNSAGWGPWSAYKSFTVETITVSVPGIPVKQSPIGTLGQAIPTYRWKAISDPNVLTYQVQLRIQSNNRRLDNRQHTASAICNSSTCELSTATALNDGVSYKWRIRAINSAGTGSWSPYSGFKVSIGSKQALSSSNLTYKGAFRFPEAWEYGGYSMTHLPPGVGPSPTGNQYGSLLVASNVTTYLAGVLSIPTPKIVNSYNQLSAAETNNANSTSIISNLFDIAGNLNPTGESIQLGDFQYLPDSNRVMWSWRDRYNVASIDHTSHGWVNANLGNPKGVWHIGPYGDIHNALTNDYMLLAPDSAKTYLGNKTLVVGNHRESGSNNGSQGPSLVATAPPTSGSLPDSSALDAIKLLDYGPQIEACMVNDSLCSFTGYRANDQWGGAAWVDTDNTSGVVVVGSKGLGTTCYGAPGDASAEGFTGSVNIPKCTDVPDKNINNRSESCGSTDKGFHSGPYEPMMVFYSAEQLLEVAQGARQPTQVKDISRQSFNGLDPHGCGQFGAVAYDESTRRMYVTETMGGIVDGIDSPPPGKTVVHVWAVD